MRLSDRYDLGSYKRLTADAFYEVVFRYVFLAFAGVLAWAVFDDAVFLVLTAVFVTLQTAFMLIIRRAPDESTMGQALCVFGLTFATMGTVLMAGIYCWFLYGDFGRLLAAFLLLAVMLNSLGLRVREHMVARIDTAMIIGALLILILGTMWVDDLSDLPILMQVSSLFGCTIYYILASVGIHKTAEKLRVAQQQEIQRARHEAMGQITGGVAHDFNNLLTVIQGNLQLRREVLARGGSVEEAEHLLQEVEQASDRAVETTRALLSHTRSDRLSTTTVHLAPLLDNLLPLLERAVTASIAVTVEADPDLGEVQVDVMSLENVILNLVINARDAIGSGQGVIAVAAKAIGGDQFSLSVRDTGPGMSAALLARVTEPYFSTKPKSTGSGLGLTLAKGFAEQSGGVMQIDSVEGVGTTVTLTLPVVAASAAKSVYLKTKPGEVG